MSGRLFAALGKTGLTRDQRITLYRWFIGRDNIDSTNDLTHIERIALEDQLWRWDREGVLKQRVRAAVGIAVLDDARGIRR